MECTTGRGYASFAASTKRNHFSLLTIKPYWIHYINGLAPPPSVRLIRPTWPILGSMSWYFVATTEGQIPTRHLKDFICTFLFVCLIQRWRKGKYTWNQSPASKWNFHFRLNKRPEREREREREIDREREREREQFCPTCNLLRYRPYWDKYIKSSQNDIEHYKVKCPLNICITRVPESQISVRFNLTTRFRVTGYFETKSAPNDPLMTLNATISQMYSIYVY